MIYDSREEVLEAQVNAWRIMEGMWTMARHRTVGVFIFDGVEVLDFAGPFEVFSVAGMETGRTFGSSAFTVLTIAEDPRTITATGGLRVEPAALFADHPDLDILVVPGGMGTRALQDHAPVIDWVRAQFGRVELMSSVCTGAFLLGLAGALEGRSATTHWASIERMRETFPTIQVRENVRFVDEGKVVTSAGISAGIDMSLAIVARLHGDDIAARTARHMEYDWRS
jgi:transcriptional regulator GlxA family with amidase domain